jgi:hypothetical protein
MPVRIIGGHSADDTGSKRRVSPLLIVIMALLLILVLAVGTLVVVALTRGTSTPTSTPQVTPSASMTPSGTATADVDDFRARLEAWHEANRDLVVEEVAPGLSRCSSRVENANVTTYTNPVTSHTWGTGFEQTIQGAVAASAEALRYRASVDWYLSDETMAEYYFLNESDRVTPDQAQDWRREAKVDDQGRVLDDQGVVIPDSELRMAAYPRYGLYRMTAQSPGANDHDAYPPTTVVIDWIIPTVSWAFGREDAPSAMARMATLTVAWESGDWHIETMSTSLFAADGSPYANVPFEVSAVYAQELGGDWCVPADGTDEPLPGYWLVTP